MSNSINLTYTRFELVRLVRNRQNFVFSLVIPVIVFLATASSNRNTKITGDVTVGRYYLAGMIGLGTIAAVFSGGARIAMERQVGWNRLLRLTPLPASTYLRTKVLTSYLMAILTMALLTIAALALGIHLPAAQWAKAVGLVLVALIPFAALGVLFGHLIRGDTLGPVIGLGVSFFAIIGGAYFPLGGDHGVLHDIVRLIPSFWLVQAGKTGIGGQGWTAEAWIVVAVWATLASAGAVWAYRRDTQRQS